MNTNTKYKFNMKGWFNESWRHMLAAKGVKTKSEKHHKYYASKGVWVKESDYWKKKLADIEQRNETNDKQKFQAKKGINVAKDSELGNITEAELNYLRETTGREPEEIPRYEAVEAIQDRRSIQHKKRFQASKYDQDLPPSIIEKDWKSVKQFTKEKAIPGVKTGYEKVKTGTEEQWGIVKQRWKDAKEERLEKQRAKEQDKYDYWKNKAPATEKELKEYQYWRK